ALRGGSVKTNIGHLEGASGIAGLIKAVLCVAHRELPPSLNFATPHPDIPLEALGLRVQTERGPWPSPERALLAGVSSFGMGGVNCHVVLASASRPSDMDGPATATHPLPFLVSARTVSALPAQATRLREHLDAQRDRPLPNLGHALATTRSALEYRAAVVAGDRAALDAGLATLAAGGSAPGLVRGSVLDGGVAFLFTGQGS